jgi:hypothetical protein
MIARCLLIAMTLTAHSAHAQVEAPYEATRSSRGIWNVDIGAQAARPIGGFRTNVNAAWGMGAAVRHHFRWFEPLGLRGDVAILNYGNERQRVPVSPTINRVMVQMTTSNNIAVASAGPELMLRRGPIQPYVYGFAGYSYFWTQSSVGSDSDGEAFASSTNFGDGGLATGWGGGVSIPLRLRKVRLAIDAGGRRTENGTRSYLRRGDIIDQPDGSLQFNSRTTDADFWQFHLGASFSFTRR